LCYSGNGFTHDLYSAWRCVELMERMGEITTGEAVRWKQGIFGLMERWEREPGDVTSVNCDPLS
jgi:hypothetical protein